MKQKQIKERIIQSLKVNGTLSAYELLRRISYKHIPVTTMFRAIAGLELSGQIMRTTEGSKMKWRIYNDT